MTRPSRHSAGPRRPPTLMILFLARAKRDEDSSDVAHHDLCGGGVWREVSTRLRLAAEAVVRRAIDAVPLDILDHQERADCGVTREPGSLKRGVAHHPILRVRRVLAGVERLRERTPELEVRQGELAGALLRIQGGDG